VEGALREWSTPHPGVRKKSLNIAVDRGRDCCHLTLSHLGCAALIYDGDDAECCRMQYPGARAIRVAIAAVQCNDVTRLRLHPDAEPSLSSDLPGLLGILIKNIIGVGAEHNLSHTAQDFVCGACYQRT
jgi:hypothetical protein